MGFLRPLDDVSILLKPHPPTPLRRDLARTTTLGIRVLSSPTLLLAFQNSLVVFNSLSDELCTWRIVFH